MLRSSAIGAFLFLAGARCVSPSNPNDIEFQLRLLNDSHSYHLGERIKLEASYTSDSAKKYRATFSSIQGGLKPHVSPPEGVVDLEPLRRDSGGPVAVSILSSSDYISSQPYWQELDLSDWFRFQEPGHYSITVTSTDVSRVKSPEEGGGLENLTIESDPVEFDILPPDPTWDAAQLREIQLVLAAPNVNGSQQHALHKLSYLDTPASLQVLLQLYLSGSYSINMDVVQGLSDTSRKDQVISALQAALSDPAANVPEYLPDLLATLQMQRDLGLAPSYPSDPDEQMEWKKQAQARSELRGKYLAQANALLLASVSRRTGTFRASAIFDAWDHVERLTAGNPPPESLIRLRQSLLDVSDDLNPSQLYELLNLGWGVFPHAQLLPIILTFTKDGPQKFPAFSEGAYRLWCEGWPADCGASILALYKQPNSNLSLLLISLPPEAEHPEFDTLLESKLKDPGMFRSSGPAQGDALLIMHIGSRNLVPDVRSLMDQMVSRHSYACRIDSYFIGYLFRFDPAEGSKRLTSELHDPKNDCALELLQSLNEVRYSDSLLPSARNSLDSPNLQAAGSAALLLSMHGRPSDADALWKRLDALWTVWHDRSAELQNLPYASTPQSQSAGLEQSLASALSHATHWTLTPAELERLRSSCLTQRCRDIADNKIILGL